jgi:uncharacterized membrane protein (UPF0136 family)
MRVIFGCVAAVVVALIGGLIMGEYQLKGLTALVAGVLFGLLAAEAGITIGKTNDWALVGVTAVAAALGLTWAAYIEAGDSVGRIAGMRWVASLVALVSAGWWVRALGSRVPRSPFAPAPEEPESTP